jgi:SAM-dependent methyltransferase
MTIANTEQAEFWSHIASTWLELEDHLEQVARLPGQMAMDRLHLIGGQRVIDVGCASGHTTLELGALVAPDGEAVGVDIAADMLVAGRARAARLGVRNATFLHADVQVHDFGEDQFDAAYSRFGVMFFADPVTAFTNIRRALRPGGSLSFVCWQSIFDNEWMLVPGAAAMSAAGSNPEMSGSDEPGPFSLANPDRIRAILDAAGYQRIDITPHRDSIVISEDHLAEVVLMSTRIGPVSETLQASDSDTRARVAAAVEAAIRDRLHDGEANLSRGTLIVVAEA